MTYFIIMIAAVVILILLEMPVGFAFGAGTILYALMTGIDISSHAVYGYFQASAFSLLAIPLFIISGNLMGSSGISNKLLDFVNSFIGRKKGGLGAVTVVSCALFGAISGSAAATIVAIGKIMYPRMVEEGYPKGHATALLSVSSVLAFLIPPSIPMIVFAVAIRESVTKAFLSTIAPGIMLTAIYCILNYIFLKKNRKIKVAPKIPFSQVVSGIGSSFKKSVLALLMPVLILGSIYGGICTPTEAGAVAFVYTLIVGFLFYRRLTCKKMCRVSLDAATLTAEVMVLLLFLFIMSRSMVLGRIPNQVADFLLTLSDNRVVLLLLINLLILFMGMIIDDVSGGVLAAIIFLPVIKQLGIDPIHFAAIVALNLGMGNITPPCAPMLYMAGGVSNLTLDQYFLPTMRFLMLGHLPMVLFVTFVPEFSMYLPNLYEQFMSG